MVSTKLRDTTAKSGDTVASIYTHAVPSYQTPIPAVLDARSVLESA